MEDLLLLDPTDTLEAPKIGRKLPDTLAYEEITQLLEAVDVSTNEGTRNRAILEVLYSSGLRVSELTELRLSNLYADQGFVRVTGTCSLSTLTYDACDRTVTGAGCRCLVDVLQR